MIGRRCVGISAEAAATSREDEAEPSIGHAQPFQVGVSDGHD